MRKLNTRVSMCSFDVSFLILCYGIVLCAYLFINSTAIILALFGFGVTMLRTIVPLWFSRKSTQIFDFESPIVCFKCGYRLTGLPSNRCPECGTTNSCAKVARLRSELLVIYWQSALSLVSALVLTTSIVILMRQVFYRFAHPVTLGRLVNWYTNGNSVVYNNLVMILPSCFSTSLHAVIISATHVRVIRRKRNSANWVLIAIGLCSIIINLYLVYFFAYFD